MNRSTNIRLRGTLLGLFLLQLASAGAADSPKTPARPDADEMKKLQGTWQVIKFISPSEKPAPAEEIATFRFEFKGDLLGMRKGGTLVGGGEPFKYRLDPTRTPRAIDVFFSGDPDEPTQGIYKLDGDELTICMVAEFRDGKYPPRPSEFKASKAAPYSLFVLKRVNDAKPSRANVFVYPEKLTPKDRLVDGPVDKASAIEITSETTLIWIDLAPDARFAHATQYVLITAQGARTLKGNWWPVLNGKPLFRDAKPYKAELPFKLTRE